MTDLVVSGEMLLQYFTKDLTSLRLILDLERKTGQLGLMLLLVLSELLVRLLRLWLNKRIPVLKKALKDRRNFRITLRILKALCKKLLQLMLVSLIVIIQLRPVMKKQNNN